MLNFFLLPLHVPYRESITWSAIITFTHYFMACPRLFLYLSSKPRINVIWFCYIVLHAQHHCFFCFCACITDNTLGNYVNRACLHHHVPQTEHSYSGYHENLQTPTYTGLGSNLGLHSEGTVTNCKEPWYSLSKAEAEDTYRIVLS